MSKVTLIALIVVGGLLTACTSSASVDVLTTPEPTAKPTKSASVTGSIQVESDSTAFPIDPDRNLNDQESFERSEKTIQLPNGSIYLEAEAKASGGSSAHAEATSTVNSAQTIKIQTSE